MDEKLGLQARSNTIDNFKYGFDDVFMDKLVERMDQNQDIFNKITDDKAFASVVKDYLLKRVYGRLKQPAEDKPLFFSDVIPEASVEEGYLPVYDLQAVATSFREQTTPKVKGWKPMNGRKINKDMFIAQVVGKSMEPTIADGSWCLFRFERGGSRNGLVVLVESQQVKDPETGLAFTIKRYHSVKEDLGDDRFKHKLITLSPDNKDFKDIILENVSGEDFRIVAEFVGIC